MTSDQKLTMEKAAKKINEANESIDKLLAVVRFSEPNRAAELHEAIISLKKATQHIGSTYSTLEDGEEDIFAQYA